jgi:hypothetical protein
VDRHGDVARLGSVFAGHGRAWFLLSRRSEVEGMKMTELRWRPTAVAEIDHVARVQDALLTGESMAAHPHQQVSLCCQKEAAR